MRRATLLLGTLLCAALGACASAPAQPVASVGRESASAACTGAPVLRPGDVAAVSPLWAANKLVKSPSYQLAGVIVELRPGQPDLLALPGLRASVDARSEHLAMILRSDDPATAREAMHRAELLLRR